MTARLDEPFTCTKCGVTLDPGAPTSAASQHLLEECVGVDDRAACYVTFGLRYAHEPHPSWPLADPDGWLKVTAHTYEQARSVAFAATGGAHAFDYPYEPSLQHFPKGELHHIQVVPA